MVAAGGGGGDGDGAGAAQLVVTADGHDVLRTAVEVGVPTRVPLAEDVRPWSPEDPFLYDVEVRLGDDGVTQLRRDALVRDRAGRAGPDASAAQRRAVPARRAARPGLLARRPLHRPVRRRARPRHPYGQGPRLHDAAQAHQDRAAALVPPLRPARDARLAGHGQRRTPLQPPRRHRLLRSLPVRLERPRHSAVRAPGRGRSRRVPRRARRNGRRCCARSPASPCGCRSTRGGGSSTRSPPPRASRALDPTRPVDHASGWHDQGGGDLASRHVYFRPYRLSRADAEDPRAAVLSEYGGYCLPGPRAPVERRGVRLPEVRRRRRRSSAPSSACSRPRSAPPSTTAWRRSSTRSSPTSRTRRTGS